MERLRSAEGVKMAVLQHDIAEVQKDITRIDEILMTMEDIAAGGPPWYGSGVIPSSIVSHGQLRLLKQADHITVGVVTFFIEHHAHLHAPRLRT